jgi:hypothetical protein
MLVSNAMGGDPMADLQFPKGDAGDFFLISSSEGPTYLLTRADLEAASEKYKEKLEAVIGAFENEDIAALDIDTVKQIEECNIIQPYNRLTRPPTNKTD